MMSNGRARNHTAAAKAATVDELQVIFKRVLHKDFFNIFSWLS